ncbi:MAG: tetratricopeptide repeat protein [Phycisphaerae bacterium]
MKSERRHKLQKNELSEEINKISQFMKVHGGKVTVVVLIAAILLLVVVYVRKEQKARAASLNWDYSQNTIWRRSAPGEEFISQMRTLIEQTDDEHVAANAAIQLAHYYIIQNRTSTELDAQAKQANEQQAVKLYKQVIERFGEQRDKVALAYLSLGQIAENDADFSKARNHFEKVTSMTTLEGHAAYQAAEAGLSRLEEYDKEIRFATTAPAPETQPATDEAAETQPATGTAPADEAATTQPATESVED